MNPDGRRYVVPGIVVSDGRNRPPRRIDTAEGEDTTVNRDPHEDEWEQVQDWERASGDTDQDEPRLVWTVAESEAAETDGSTDGPADPDATTGPDRPRRPAAPVKVVVAAGVLLLAAAIWVTAGGDGSRPTTSPPSGAEMPEPSAVPEPGFTEPPTEPTESPGPPEPTSAPAASDPAPIAGPPSPATSRSPAARRPTAPRSPQPSAVRRITRPDPIAPRAGVTVRLVSLATGKSAGVSQGSGADGARITQSGDAVGSAQHWRMVAGPSGCYQLINVRSGKSLDNTDGTSTNGTQMQQWTWYQASANQSWCFRSVGSGRYSIRNMTSGFLLDVRDGGTADGVAVQQWNADPAAPNANQTWLLAPVP